MNISSVSINRPVLATVISLLLLLFGIIGYFFLGVREYPSVDPPIVTVSTNYPGANADATTILVITLQSNKRSLMDLSDLANELILSVFEAKKAETELLRLSGKLLGNLK
jgi:multidrug efflux pump subunit AcrB